MKILKNNGIKDLWPGIMDAFQIDILQAVGLTVKTKLKITGRHRASISQKKLVFANFLRPLP